MSNEDEIIVESNPKSPISEIFKNLRTNIQFMSTNGKLKCLLVTSTLPGEGQKLGIIKLGCYFCPIRENSLLS